MAKNSKEIKTTDKIVSAHTHSTDAIAQRLPSWLSHDWFWALILILLVIQVYLPVWWAGFIWDDGKLSTANPCIVGPLGLKEIWTTKAADICPLTITTFWVEYALWGLPPLGYHLANVFQHAASAVVLWRVLLSLRVPGAWLGAALWAVHPVEVESVAWVSEMKNTESGLFFLLSILFFVRWLKAREIDGRKSGGWNYALTLLFAALAMASKSSTVILPVVLCLCAWWTEGRWHWRNLVKVGPIFLMSAAATIPSIWTQNLQIANDSTPLHSWPERLVTAGDVVCFYLGKLIWPHPLITIYPRWQIDAGQWISYLPLLAVISVLFILWLKRESWSRPWFFAFAYFLVALFPVLGLASLSFSGLSFVADHFQYLASMGPLALAGAGMARFSDFVIPEKPWLQSSLCAGLLLILGMTSWQRTWVYENEETLWTDTLAQNPNCCLGYVYLGLALVDKGHVDEGMTQYQKALEINPNYDAAYVSLGLALLQKGQVDEAVAQFQRALEINPDYAEAHLKLGDVLLQRNQTDEAIAEYQKTLEIDPTSVLVHDSLGLAFLQKQQVDAAIEQFQQALEINPNSAKARDNLGAALFNKGQVDAAIEQFQKGLKIDPTSAKAHNNLGLALGQKGQADEAMDQFQKALAINPNYAEAHNNLGIAFAKKRQLDEALAQFQEALRLRPDDNAAQIDLAKIKAMIQQKAAQ
jgi:tetratricopeptide (TPR) repeat protein